MLGDRSANRGDRWRRARIVPPLVTSDNAASLLGIDTRVWLALGQAVLALAAVVGGAWALNNHRRAKRREGARWLHGMFRDFYLGEKFEAVREQLEYGYATRLGPLLERRIADREVPLDALDKKLLRQLDTLLIYIDHVLYLRDKRQIGKRDVAAIFTYWIELMSQPEHASLRCYVRHFEFRRVGKALKANSPRFVALCEPSGDEADRSARGSVIGGRLRKRDGRPPRACVIRGRLREHDGRFVLTAGDDTADTVEGTLLDLGDARGVLRGDLLRRHDRRAGYDPQGYDSPCVRRIVRLVSPPRDAWVYLYSNDAQSRRPPPGP